jgi:hypothetical protein
MGGERRLGRERAEQVAPMAGERRLGRALAHLRPGGAAAAVATDTETGNDDDAQALLPGLSAEQLAEFNRVGYCVVPTELAPEFCSDFYAKAKAQAEEDASGPSPTDHAAVLEARNVRGALSSILGPDYYAPSFGALHKGMNREQPFHCDGTDHAVTLTTVRDHKPRRLICMFYPESITREMGPTAIMPRTQVFGVNREGFSHSENRLTTHYGPESNGSTERFQAATQAFEDQAQLEVGTPDAVDRVDDAREAMGDTSLEEMYLTVPAGSFVIAHWDIMHRASKRLTEDARFRPMIAYRGVVRMSEPGAVEEPQAGARSYAAADGLLDERDARVAATAAGTQTSLALQAELNSFLLNEERPVAERSDEECAELQETVLSSLTEERRLDAAYQLGHATRAGSQAALSALFGAVGDEREHVRRAAFHGFCAGGAPALPTLLSVVERSAGIELHPRPELPHVDPAQNSVVFAIHAVGQLIPELSAEEAETAARTVCAAMERAATELQASVDAGLPAWVGPATPNPWPQAPLFFPVIERRRTLAEGCTTLGRLGQHARICGEPTTCLLALDTLLAHALADEPGLEVESYLNGQIVRANAATSLSRVFSGGRAPQLASIPDAAWQTAAAAAKEKQAALLGSGAKQADYNDQLAALVSEAARRASLLPSEGLDGEVAAVFAAVRWPFPVDAGRSKGL